MIKFTGRTAQLAYHVHHNGKQLGAILEVTSIDSKKPPDARALRDVRKKLDQVVELKEFWNVYTWRVGYGRTDTVEVRVDIEHSRNTPEDKAVRAAANALRNEVG